MNLIFWVIILDTQRVSDSHLEYIQFVVLRVEKDMYVVSQIDAAFSKGILSS
jgi:hypothetical protein